jgi:hypothetical protein
MPALCARAASAQETASPQPTPVIVVGFVGGHVHRDDVRHSEVQLIDELQATYGKRVRAEIFENRSRAEALQFVLRALNDKAEPAAQQPSRPMIILFGHSWGASATVYLARDLEQRGIPVALSIQVDSVPKNGVDDSVIPANVQEAINFYQDTGRIRGEQTIVAADASRTVILGNFLYHYEKEPAECRPYPWYDRMLYKGHTSIECDPRVWSQVRALIAARLPSPAEPKVAELPEVQGPNPAQVEGAALTPITETNSPHK